MHHDFAFHSNSKIIFSKIKLLFLICNDDDDGQCTFA